MLYSYIQYFQKNQLGGLVIDIVAESPILCQLFPIFSSENGILMLFEVNSSILNTSFVQIGGFVLVRVTF